MKERNKTITIVILFILCIFTNELYRFTNNYIFFILTIIFISITYTFLIVIILFLIKKKKRSE